MKKKEFAEATFDPNYKAFMIYIAALNHNFDLNIEIYPLQKTQLAYLNMDKTFKKVFTKYIKFTDFFSLKLAGKLLKYININNHIIKPINNR